MTQFQVFCLMHQ